MMTYARGHNALRVGVLAMTGALSFAALFFYSTNRVLGSVRSTIYLRLNAADGLQRGDAVLHRGVNVGEVKAIDFSETDVVVRIRLTRIVPVSSSANAEMVAADIFGRQSIVIHDGTKPAGALAEGDTLHGKGPVSMTARIEDLGDRVGTLLSDSTIADVRRTLHAAGTVASGATSAVDQVGQLARSADAMIGEQRQAFGELMSSANLLASNLADASDAEDLVRLRARIEASAENLSRATAGMDSAASSLRRILSRVEAGEGSAGRLLTDAALYDRVTGSVSALEKLLIDVRENPKRYVTIKVF